MQVSMGACARACEMNGCITFESLYCSVMSCSVMSCSVLSLFLLLYTFLVVNVFLIDRGLANVHIYYYYYYYYMLVCSDKQL